MPRYEVVIELRSRFVFAIEAADPNEAQQRALEGLGPADPEEQHMTIDVERGVN